MLEEEILVSELAGSQLGSEDKLSDQDFCRVGVLNCVDIVEFGSGGNSFELLREGGAGIVIGESGIHV